ncbi:hypothetical protein G6F68_013670 [Rhizopus microsporus]|nr:hypothetical protein G6F68_013670 [Rhizopus microsporus]
MIVNIDRKTRSIQLSIKARDNAETADTIQRMSDASASSGTTNLGALLKAKLDQQRNDAGRPRHRLRGQDRAGCNDPGPGLGSAHRDPRFWQLLVVAAVSPSRSQSEIRRTSAGAWQTGAALQGGQGIARTGRPGRRQ